MKTQAAIVMAVAGWLAVMTASAQQTVVLSGLSSSGDGDGALVEFLTNKFENVDLTYGDYSDFDAHSNTIASADVFMVGRRIWSPTYANPSNSAKFNALTNAVVAFTGYLTRPNSGRWGWHSGSVSYDSLDGDETTVTVAGASVFDLAEGAYDWYTGSNAALNASSSGTVGDGDILATIGNNIVAAGWEAGELSAGGVAFGGKRLLFNLHEAGGTIMPEGAGRVALIKALAAYTPLVPSVEVEYVSLPVDGSAVTNAYTDIVITAYDIKTNLNSIISGYDMWVNSNLVSVVTNASDGLITFTHTPETALTFGSHAVQLQVYRTDGVTNTVDFTFKVNRGQLSGSFLLLADEINTVCATNATIDWADPDGDRNVMWDDRSLGQPGADFISAEDPELGAITNSYEGTVGSYLLKTTLNGLTPGEAYQVWIVNTLRNPEQVTEQFGLQGGFEGDSLTAFVNQSGSAFSNATVATEIELFSSGTQWKIFEADLGATTADSSGEIHVIISGLTDGEFIGDGTGDRTVYHGLAYAPVSSTLQPAIQSLNASNGEVSITWTSEAIGTYSVQSKVNLSSGSWSTLTNGISGEEGTTSVTVDMSDVDQEFYRIEVQ